VKRLLSTDAGTCGRDSFLICAICEDLRLNRSQRTPAPVAQLTSSFVLNADREANSRLLIRGLMQLDHLPACPVILESPRYALREEWTTI